MAELRDCAREFPEEVRSDLSLRPIELGDARERAGRLQDAVAAVEEAVSLRRRLAAERAERHPFTLAAAEESVAMRRVLAAKDPEAHRSELAWG